MASKLPPVVFDDDNPEWTEADFARARPADEVLPPAIAAALLKRGRGRPAGSDKEQVTLRLDRDVLERFRAGGPGWQTRVNATLAARPIGKSLGEAARLQGPFARRETVAV